MTEPVSREEQLAKKAKLEKFTAEFLAYERRAAAFVAEAPRLSLVELFDRAHELCHPGCHLCQNLGRDKQAGQLEERG